MIKLEPLILIVTGLFNLGLSLFVLTRNAKKLGNLTFAGVSFALGGWTLGIAGFLLTNRAEHAIIWAKIYYFFPQLVAISIIIFAQVFGSSKKLTKGFILPILVGFIAIVGPLLLPNYLILGLEYHEWGKEIVLDKGHYLAYSIYLLACLIGAELIMLSKSRSFKGIYRLQARLFFAGFLVTGILGVLFNLFYPWFGNYRLIWLGPLFTSAFVMAISYSIIKHKMFDIKAVLVRSIAYLFSLTFILGIYSALLFGAGAVFVQLDTIDFMQWVVIGTLALILAATYNSVVNLFNRVTNRLFLRDAYDTQEVLDKVSGIIVGNVDPHKIQKDALQELQTALRSTHMAFLLTTGSGELRKGNAVGDQWRMHDASKLSVTLMRSGKRIVLYDELEEDSPIKNVLRQEDISAVSPLVTKEEIIGYLVLGPKKSGNIYNSQDVGLLNIASNELAVALQNAQRFEEIQAFNITLQQKVTEATRELKRTNRKLVALDEAKDEFISMASHQLRTPLTSIKGYLSMIIEGDLGKVSVPQEKALKEAFGSSQRMVYLIADFLNVSRIKTGKFVIEPKEVDLPQLVSEEITQLREMASSRDITLEYEPPGVFPRIQLDDNKIRQVMMNMVDNAIYYTPADGKVTIQLYVSGEEVIFKVIDTGIGVPKREQHKLFTKFFRANNARKARPDGTGLGLFMAQKIIVEQGGAIIFESTEGKGSTFGFRFPLKLIKV